MNDSAWFMAVVMAFIALGAYAIQPRRETNAKLAAWRAEEERDLAQLSIHVSDAGYSVDGVSATTVDRSEEITCLDNGEISQLSVQRFLRNPHGEYFMWLWRSGAKPYVKHVPQVNARIVLKDKYIPPRGGINSRLKG